MDSCTQFDHRHLLSRRPKIPVVRKIVVLVGADLRLMKFFIDNDVSPRQRDHDTRRAESKKPIPTPPSTTQDQRCPPTDSVYTLSAGNPRKSIMWILPLVGYIGLILGFCFLTLAIGRPAHSSEYNGSYPPFVTCTDPFDAQPRASTTSPNSSKNTLSSRRNYSNASSTLSLGYKSSSASWIASLLACRCSVSEAMSCTCRICGAFRSSS